MKKIKVLTSFYYNEFPYQAGQIYNLNDTIADKLEKEKRIIIISNLTDNEIEKAIEDGVVIDNVDLSNYATTDLIIELQNQVNETITHINNITHKIITLNDYLSEDDNNCLDDAMNKISSIISDGDTVVLKDGNYVVSSATILFTHNNVKILGTGNVLISFLTKEKYEVKNLNNITIENIMFKEGQRLQFKSCKNLFFKNILVEEFSNSGLVFMNCENVEIDNCRFNNIGRRLTGSIGSGGYAIGFDGNTTFGKNRKFKIHDCYFTNTTGRGAIFITDDSNEFEIYNNTFFETGYSAIALAISGYKGVIGIIRNNNIRRCGLGLRSELITVDPATAGVGASAIYCSTLDYDNEILVYENNIVDSIENAIEGRYYLVKNNTIINTGIDLINFPTPSTEGIYGAQNIIGNYLCNTKGGAIKCSGSYTIKNMHIENNIIKNCNVGIYLNSQSGEQSFDNTSITSNSFSNINAKGIHIESNCRNNNNNIQIVGNTFFNTIQKYAINSNAVYVQDSYDVIGKSTNRFLNQDNGVTYTGWINSKSTYTNICTDENLDRVMRIFGESNEYGAYVYQDFIVNGYNFLINVDGLMKFVNGGSIGIQVEAFDIGGNKLLTKRTKLNINETGLFNLNSTIDVLSTEKTHTLRVAILNRSANTDKNLDIYNAQIIINKN